MTDRRSFGVSIGLACICLSIFVVFLLPVAASGQESASPSSEYRVLVFSKTAQGAFRHASIPAGVGAVQRLGAEHGFQVDATEDAGVFASDSLGRYAAVVFLNTNRDVLDETEQAGFERYIRGGGGWVGVHSAASTEYDWPFYAGLLGAHFDKHPKPQPATVRVLDRVHPATAHLPVRWERFDEWYNFRTNPRGSVHVLMTLDEKSYEGGTMGTDHPIAWAHEYEGGRAFYTGLGHTDETFAEPLFLQHLLGGIEWAARRRPGDVQATVAGAFRKEVLAGADEITDPMELDVAPDGRVFFVEREGAVKLWDPATQSVKVVGFVPTWATHNEGMMGLALDPTFAENGWLYVYHSPMGEEEVNEVVRFTVAGDRLDPASKRVLLKVPTERSHCCHSGGSLAFGPDGSLYVGTGDNTNPRESFGFAPLDEQPGRSGFDAQRSSSNSQDLRGKVLRIRPFPDGTYAIPEGNLFPGGEGGRPEIFAMGTRNAYRLSVDQERGWVYWGDVGPDAGSADPERGPESYDEINQARRAGNYGWPYFVGDNKAYRDFDFSTNTPGPAFDPQAPVNDSPNNTGARQLPPAQPAWIWYPYGPSEEFPELDAGGRVAMAGPVYHYDAATAGPAALPPYHDGSVLIYEWARGWIKDVKVDEQGRILQIVPFLPEMEFRRPMDMELGPDGSLYLIEWGTDYEGYNKDVQIVRLVYTGAGEEEPRPQREEALTSSNGEPHLSLSWPPQGGFFRFGEEIPFEVMADDATGGGTEVGRAVVRTHQGYNTHTKPLGDLYASAGTLVVPRDERAAPFVMNRFALLEVGRPTAGGEADVHGSVLLHPMRLQAEHANRWEGVEREINGSIRTRSRDVLISMVGGEGGYLAFSPVNLVNIDSAAFRVQPIGGGKLELRAGSPDGTLLAQVTVSHGDAGTALQKAGANLTEPTSAAILKGLWSIKNDNLGGLTAPLTFAEGQPAKTGACWFAIQIQANKWVSPDNFSLTCY